MHRVKLNINYLIASLAIVFVVYHLSQIAMIPVSLGSILNTHTTAPVVQHKTVPSPTSVPTSKQVKTGLTSQQSQWPIRVFMPSVKIDLPLEGSIEETGAWKISETGANFALNTAIPNESNGNTVLFGHDRPKLFHDIHGLKIGDPITVFNSKGSYTFTMVSSKVVTPTDVSVMDQTELPILTLLTCDGWLSQNRYVVVAKFSHFTPIAPKPTQNTAKLASL